MEYPIELKSSDGELVHTMGSGRNRIEVREHKGLRWLHFGSEAIQAMLDLDYPSIPIIPYQRAMLSSLLYCEAPSNVLNLGTGGGSFERFFIHTFPQTEVTSVESNSDLIKLLPDYFPIPENVRLVNTEAAAYLADHNNGYDLVLCDLFSSEQHPACISQPQFYKDAINNLTENGVFVLNTLPITEAGLLDILLAVRISFKRVFLLELHDFKNVLLFCLRGEAPNVDLVQHRCRHLREITGIDLSFALEGCLEIPGKGNQIQNNIPNR